MRVMTQNYYGYALVKGFYATVKTNGDDDIAAMQADGVLYAE